MAENPLAEGPRYEVAIAVAGGIDLQVLGIGTDGHIGFNEPTSSLGSKTRVKTLTKRTLEDNARFFQPDEFQPQLAITMGIATIMEARRILLIATGEGKAQAVRGHHRGAVWHQSCPHRCSKCMKRPQFSLIGRPPRNCDSATTTSLSARSRTI